MEEVDSGQAHVIGGKAEQLDRGVAATALREFLVRSHFSALFTLCSFLCRFPDIHRHCCLWSCCTVSYDFDLAYWVSRRRAATCARSLAALCPLRRSAGSRRRSCNVWYVETPSSLVFCEMSLLGHLHSSVLEE
jgi:hypothetical protein